jgi:predicted AAA+ superfamily ATPase
MIKRLQIFQGRGKESAFLWGPRQSGKSTLLKQLFPRSRYFDLLQSDEFERLLKKPSALREELSSPSVLLDGPIIMDEVQKIPALLDEIQWLIVNRSISFILCGSSARKLKRGGGNMLGGRALRYQLFPLVSREIPAFDLLRGLNQGFLPRHYLADDPGRMVQAYVGDYLKEEIAAEAMTRNIPAFSRFLEVAAFSNGEIVNFTNIAAECGISAATVRNYFEIIEETLVGGFLPSFQKRPKRRVIQAPRFYYFDVGLANFLLKRGTIVAGGEMFGKAFEHFIYQELTAHRHYSGLEYALSYWRTASQLEVDFILGDHQVAVEVKGTDMVNDHHLRGLKSFCEEYPVKKAIVVSMDPRPRQMGAIEVLPWALFLDQLWSGKLIH